jgi:hypothetical protein
MIEFLYNQIRLIRKRHQLRVTQQFLFVLRDQVESGQFSIRHYEEQERRLRGEIAMLAPVDDVVRDGVVS